MKRTYNIADINFCIETPFTYKDNDCFNKYIGKLNSIKNINIKLIKQDEPYKFDYPVLYDKNYIKIYQGKKGLIREYTGLSRGRSHGCLFELSDNNTYYEYHYYTNPYETLKTTFDIFDKIAFEYILYKENTFILHSSYIKYKNKAILFSAPSGTGKSTQAELWEKYARAEIINGDRVAINKNNGKWCAYGLPFAGSSRIYKNVTTPIGTIVILRQSKENSIKKLNKLEAFRYIYSETTINSWHKGYINTIINLIEEFVKEIPIFMLECKPDNTAVQLLKETLRGEV